MSTSDFTDRVTHLIANAHGGAKYTVSLTMSFAEPSITRIVLVRTGKKDPDYDNRVDKRIVCYMVTW